MRNKIVLSCLLLASLTVPAHAGGAAAKNGASVPAGASCPASGGASFAWLVVDPTDPSPVSAAGPTACGDCPGLCTSSYYCDRKNLGDECTIGDRSLECIEIGRCAKYICCGCGQPPPAS